MTLGELIAKLEALDPAQVWRPGFGKGASWRGSYEQVAFEPVEQATVGEMLAHARAAVGTTLHGYKGGEYLCGLDTDCNVSRWGEYGGDSDRMNVWWAANVETAVLRAALSAAESRAEEAERERDGAGDAAARLQRQILGGDALCPTCQGHGTMGTGRPDAHGEGEEIGPCPDCHEGFIPNAGARVLVAERALSEARGALREEVALLRAWARESHEGGWSTHQVDPMLRRANDLEPLAAAPASTKEETDDR